MKERTGTGVSDSPCFACVAEGFCADTRVPLLDGTQKTLQALTGCGDFWVYSIGKDQRIAPGKARAHRTRVRSPLVRVVVSGGEQVVCAPAHRFMLSDGSYKRAGELRFNDSLMPLYRKWDQRDGYEKASSGKGTARATHLLVYDYMNGPVPRGHVVHHVNHNHFDNSPPNLALLAAAEHSRHHRRRNPFRNHDPDFQAARLAGIARKNADPTRRAQMIDVGRRNIETYMRERPEHFRDSVRGNGIRGAAYLRKFNTSPRHCEDCGHLARNPAALRWHKKKEHGYNHKVVSVDRLVVKGNVYCLQVEHHESFALAAGVFVHASPSTQAACGASE